MMREYCVEQPLSRDGRAVLTDLLSRAVDLGVRFKADPGIYGRRAEPEAIRDQLLTVLPVDSSSPREVLAEFEATVLPLCKNEASPRFMGFGDTGDDPCALMGSVLSALTQQNMINQSFDSPSATFVEIAVLRWLRELLGYPNPAVGDVRTVWDVGGILTPGGTMSNTVAMMLAREHAAPQTMRTGVLDPGRCKVVVPAGIGHYSVKAALTWIGCGNQLVEVGTTGFRYDRDALAATLREHRGSVMAVIAYAGDSRTQTVEHLHDVHDLVREIDPGIWLHADACWGLLATFTPALAGLIDGISEFDSVTVDPHKVMAIPYGMSGLLVRDPETLRSISTHSDLIMQEDFAFGQVTPFIGTKDWSSLKLWMMMRGRGRTGLADLAEQRLSVTTRFTELVDAHPRLVRLNEPDLAAVVFAYLPHGITADGCADDATIARINELNVAIHQRILADGHWYLHHFTLPDDLGRLRHKAILRPQRFMANNPRVTEDHLHGVLDYLDHLATEIEGELL
ncbi:pyridoxal phosphate-dependent decarboxylase family protein [Nocardia nova]|uniref:pyridoxal phosphate-dependent decarboxylase family protein n=1 Tax=Nocardia nova TaxID=37330 RepID=UPI0033FBA8A6